LGKKSIIYFKESLVTLYFKVSVLQCIYTFKYRLITIIIVVIKNKVLPNFRIIKKKKLYLL